MKINKKVYQVSDTTTYQEARDMGVVLIDAEIEWRNITHDHMAICR